MVLKSSTESNKMSKPNKLSIHHLNLYDPKHFCITKLCKNADSTLLAAIRRPQEPISPKYNLSIIDIYIIEDGVSLKFLKNIITYEELTGIAWTPNSHLIVVSKEPTMSLYRISDKSKLAEVVTDYGPITCMSIHGSMIFTGTEYGYIASYILTASDIQPLTKLVKINSAITDVDCFMKLRPDAPVQRPVTPGKRKLSSDDSDDSDSDDEIEFDPLKRYDVTIIGSTGRDIVVWDYHKKTIIDTIHVSEDEDVDVNVILNLKNGDIVAGDSAGNLSIYNIDTLTCRYSTNILDGPILAIAKDRKEHRLIVSGSDPTIMMLKQARADSENYILFEKIQFHTHDVTCLMFLNHNLFISASTDGLIGRFELQKKEKTKNLHRSFHIPNYGYNIQTNGNELLLQYPRFIVVWSLLKPIEAPRRSTRQASQESSDCATQEEPQAEKVLFVKTKEYIRTSAICDKYIAYADRLGVTIFKRNGKQLLPFETLTSMIDCDKLAFDSNTENLIAASGNTLTSIQLLETKLDDASAEKQEDDDKEAINFKLETRITMHVELKSSIHQILNFESAKSLVISCNYPKPHIYVYKSPSKGSGFRFDEFHKFSLSQLSVAFITYNSAYKRDKHLYIYTTDNRVLSFNPNTVKAEQELAEQIKERERIEGLDADTEIHGMLFLSKDVCIIYSNFKMYKYNHTTNCIVNQRDDYKYIVKLESISSQPEQLVLLEMKPQDYAAGLPAPTIERKRFGS